MFLLFRHDEVCSEAVNTLIDVNPVIQKCFVGAQLVIPAPQKSAQVSAIKSKVKVEIDPYQLLYEGVSLLKSGEHSKAKKLFSKVLKIKNLPEAYYYRGLCNYKMHKWKPAYKDFEIAKRNSSLDSKMKADASELYAFTYKKHCAKIEERREVWADVGKAVGTTLLAVGTVAAGVVAESIAANPGYGYGTAASFYSPSVSVGSVMPSGIASMSTSQFNSYLDSQLTDLFYMTAFQVEQQNMNEYMQATNGGQLMSYDQWMSLKAQSMVQTSGVGYDIVDDGSSYHTDYEQRKKDNLNRAVGEACLTCKGTGKCPACNGTKVAGGFGNTYKCTLCNDNGDCPTCHGTKLTSWNR